MCDIPIEILDDEKIARAIKTPFHLNRKRTKLSPAAFRPKPERDDLSVMRLQHMGSDKCKDKAKSIAKDSYVGLAALDAYEIRGSGAEVEDSRVGQFCGHADISQGTPAPRRGEAAPPLLLARYKALSDMARLYIDPEPHEECWTGGLIE